MIDLEPHEVEYVGQTACAFGSLILAVRRGDHEQIAIDVKRILDAATRYARALDDETKPADRALLRAIDRLGANDR